MALATAASYDMVAYPAYAYDYTHPDRLATVASLYGMQPTPLSRCRVLELGAGTGANLLPMAYEWPDSEFVGIDLSSSAIAQGQAAVSAAELTNVDLRHCNIMDVGPEFGRFDYVIAHGVYSWVPAAVRERMLALCSECLTPHGVAYISYNCLPGSHLRNVSREIMRYHTRPIDDPSRRISQARSILKAISELSAADTPYGAVLRRQHKQVSKMGDEVLFHDDLSDENTPFLLSEVVAAAERHGLQYLADATYFRADLKHMSEPARALLERFPESEVVARDQYQDFIEGHSFRRTLLCRGEIKLNRALTPDCVQRFHLNAEAMPEDKNIDLSADVVTTFKFGTDNNRLSTDHGLSKAAMLQFSRCWPGTLTFPELLESSLDLLGEAADPIRVNLEDQVAALTNVLFRAAMAGYVSLHLYPPKLTTRVGERPKASRLARRAAETGALITNLAHGTVILEDIAVRRFLPLVDGTRTVDELVADLAAALGGESSIGDASAEGPGKPEVTRRSVERNLVTLARLGLLEA
jgi:SAM-dependent methyltransferase